MTTPRPSLEDLGALVYRARQARGWGRRKASQQDGAPASPITWEKVETGKVVQDLTFAGIERALGWPAGSMQGYLDGGPEPTAAERPRIDVASYDELLDELRRRHDADRAELARRLHPVLTSADDETETAESVAARGMIPGLHMDDAGSGDAAGGQR